jgi:hypothetical protein
MASIAIAWRRFNIRRFVASRAITDGFVSTCEREARMLEGTWAPAWGRRMASRAIGRQTDRHVIRICGFLKGLIVTGIAISRRVFIGSILMALLALQGAMGTYQGVKLVMLREFGGAPTRIRGMTAGAIIADT